MVKNKQIKLIWLCWLVYTCAYLGRYSYNSNIIPIEHFYGVSHVESGWAMTFFFFAYGAGQIINGIFCKYYNKKIVLTSALVVSGIINIVAICGIPFVAIKYLWLINGIAQSFLWTSLLLLLGTYLTRDNLRKAVFVMSTTVACGTLASYGLSALLALFDGFKFSFIIGAICMTVVAATWFFSYNSLTTSPVDIKGDSEEKENSNLNGGNSKLALVFMISVLALFAIICNFIKDGLNSWVPSILKDWYNLPDSLSIICTLVLPVLAIFGTQFMLLINRKVKGFISLAGVLFFLSSIFILAVILLLKTSVWALILLCFGGLSLLTAGINNVITSMAPIFMRSKINSGMLAGILNGFCYVGSTIATFGLAMIEQAGGWNMVFNVFLVASIIPVVIAVVLAVIKHIKDKRVKKGEREGETL